MLPSCGVSRTSLRLSILHSFLDLLRTDCAATRVICLRFFVYISMYTLYTILLIILATLWKKVLPINPCVGEAIGAHYGSSLTTAHLYIRSSCNCTTCISPPSVKEHPYPYSKTSRSITRYVIVFINPCQGNKYSTPRASSIRAVWHEKKVGNIQDACHTSGTTPSERVHCPLLWLLLCLTDGATPVVTPDDEFRGQLSLGVGDRQRKKAYAHHVAPMPSVTAAVLETTSSQRDPGPGPSRCFNR